MAEEAYGRVVRTFWTDPEIKRLPKDLKLLLLYFFTSNLANMVGVYYCPFTYAANETSLPLEEIGPWTAGPLAQFVTYDSDTEEVFVHNSAKLNIGPQLNDKGKNGKPDRRIAGVEKLIEAIHSPRLKQAFLDRYGEDYHLNPVKERRQKPRLEKRDPGMVEFEKDVVDHYRKAHPKRLRGLVPEKISRLLRVALKSYTVEQLCRAIDGNAGSEFHQENGHQGLDLILRDASKIDYYLSLADKKENEVQMMTDGMGREVPHRRNPAGDWVPAA